ncbi:MAG: CPBP family intramembrane metalloprotease [Spirochaetia bacterium]|nr:CPBP family intramembrane metalloprotease [Spirochaetia bacterium]
MDKKSRKFFYLLMSCMEFGLVGIAAVVAFFRHIPLPSIINSAAPAWPAVAAGAAAGLPLGLLVSFTGSKITLFKSVYELLSTMFTTYNLKLFDIIIISVTAGICEEILFRGVLQTMWGIRITSFVFILLHGYFNPTDWKMSVFGLVMFALSLLIGTVYIHYGLFAAMAFHVAYDVGAMVVVGQSRATTSRQETRDKSKT